MNKTNPLTEALIFFGFTLGLSYLVFWGPLALFQVPTISFVSKTQGPLWAILLFISGGFVPSFVAIGLTGFREGKPGLKRMGRRIVQFKIGWRWYLAAVTMVALGACGQILLTRLFGNNFDLSLFVQQLSSFPALLILGPLSEELGWRGYAQERLQTSFNPILSSLIVGVIWGLWHLPLFLMPGTSQHELGIPFAGLSAASQRCRSSSDGCSTIPAAASGWPSSSTGSTPTRVRWFRGG